MIFELEVIAFNIDSCRLAEEAGAHRIELCDNPAEGGTTPSFGMIQTARETTNLQLCPIIRPRGGDFLYAAAEFDIIKKDIKLCRELGCDGVVIGMLQPDGRVDKEKTARLVDIAYPMGVCFHRAFDRTRDPFEALEALSSIGIERILTSGLKPTAMEGKELIRELVQKAADHLTIMPGSGIRSENILELAEFTGATAFHSSARISLQSKMDFQNKGMNESLTSTGLDKNEVRNMAELLGSYFEKSPSNL